MKIIILVILVASGSLILYFTLTKPSFDNLAQELDHIVSDFVEEDDMVHNCVLSMMKGDGFFSWSGAAGLANRDNHSPMTKDTPVYIASITKLYTAMVIMDLYEEQ